MIIIHYQSFLYIDNMYMYNIIYISYIQRKNTGTDESRLRCSTTIHLHPAMRTPPGGFPHR